MTVPTDTFETYASIGNREDLTDVIYNIAPIDTPFISGIEVTDATATLHEWQTDTLAAAAQNAVIEGDDATTTAAVATVRPSNTCQISDKVPRVTGSQQAILKAGRGDELEYQIAKMAKEIKRDMESDLLRNNAEVTGSSGTARELGGVPTWLTSNLSEAGDATTSTGGGDNARTDGTARAFTEAQLKSVIKQCWDEGGDPDCLMLGSFNKQVASTFTGNATREVGAADRQLYAAIDIYDSDFGELQIMPNRFQDASHGFVFQKDMWAVAYLRQFQLQNLAKTGDSERRQLIVEFTQEARNEAASGAVYDLTSS